MIVSRGRRYVFVHIPKTGGTSMAQALETRALKDDILIGDTPKALRRRQRLKGVSAAGRLWKHATLADIDGLVTPGDLVRSFCFTLVRNPWDRMVSYYHWLRDQRFDHPAVSLARQNDFTGFLTAPQTRDSIQASPYGRYMTMADGRERCDLFIRLEHLAQDAGPLWEHLGFTLDVAHENASDRAADYRGYYTDETAQLLAGLCATDIARFGYTFG